MKKLTLTLTDKQFEALYYVLMLAPKDMSRLAEDWEAIAAEKNENGEVKYPEAAKIADSYTEKALRCSELYEMIRGIEYYDLD